MNSFAWGALGALAVIFALGLVRRLAWGCRFHWTRARGPYGLRFLFNRLGARPDQEKVISAEADALVSEVRALREDLRTARAELADLVASPALDASAVAAAFDRRLERITAVRVKLAEAIARVHATLDPEQRARLAELLRRGRHGPHRRGWAHA